VQAGQILAAAVFLPMSALLPQKAFQSWGWRVPFLLSALVVLAGTSSAAGSTIPQEGTP
jgi:hypothetical protein